MNRNWLLFLLYFIPLLLWSQVSFVTHAPSQVETGRQFSVSFVLTNANGSDFSVPSFKDFQVVAGPMTSQSHSFQSINGKSSSISTTSYDYVLVAPKNGQFRIPSASIRANGRVMRTAPIRITVSGTISSPTSAHVSAAAKIPELPNHHGTIGNNDLFFTAELSKKKVYEQEPITLTYNCYIQSGVGLQNISLQKKPEFKGFWTQEIELPRNLAPQIATLHGKQYKVAKNLEYLLFPQQAGKLSIPSMTFDCEVMNGSSTIDEIEAFFRGGGNLSSLLQRSTQPLSVEVLPLPSPRPLGFSGGVGHLTVEGKLLNEIPKTNDIATYRITIKGTGNLKLIKAPAMIFSKTFDSYSPKLQEKTHTSREGLKGEIYFDYNFVPREVGTFTIPATQFTYFDTKKETYVTLQTQPLTLDIQKGKRSMEEVEAEIALQQSDIRDIHLAHPSIFSEKSVLWMGSWAYLFLIGAISCAAILLWKYAPQYYYRFSDVDSRRTRKASVKAHKQMRSAEKLLNSDSILFYNAMAHAVLGYFADKFQEDRSALTHQRIEECLRIHSVTMSDISETRKILEEIDFGRFANSQNPSSCSQLFQRANTLLQRLESQIK